MHVLVHPCNMGPHVKTNGSSACDKLLVGEINKEIILRCNCYKIFLYRVINVSLKYFFFVYFLRMLLKLDIVKAKPYELVTRSK